MTAVTGTSTELLRAIASFDAPAVTGERFAWPSAPLGAAAFATLLVDVARERVAGHLCAAIEGGALPATDAQRTDAVHAHQATLAVDLVLERALLTAVDDLERAGIDVRVLKGAAIAHTVYPAPELRSFRDVDLLVRDQQLDVAIAVLSEQGATRRFREPRPRFNRRFGKGVCVRTADGVEVDLHRVFAAGPFGLQIVSARLFEQACTVPLGGTTITGLDPTARALHAAFHAALGDDPPRLVALRDVLQVLDDPALDPRALVDLAQAWRCGIVLQRAVHLTMDAFGADLAQHPIGEFAYGYVPSPFEQRALRTYIGAHRGYAQQAVAGVGAVHGWRAKVAYVGALVVPEPAYVAERDGGYLRRLGRGARLLVDEWQRR
jgi:putative nucleotidyltransferase-like protein